MIKTGGPWERDDCAGRDRQCGGENRVEWTCNEIEMFVEKIGNERDIVELKGWEMGWRWLIRMDSQQDGGGCPIGTGNGIEEVVMEAKEQSGEDPKWSLCFIFQGYCASCLAPPWPACVRCSSRDASLGLCAR